MRAVSQLVRGLLIGRSARYWVYVPPRAHEIFGLDFDGAHLAVLGVFLDVLYQFLFLVLELRPFAVQFALCLFEGSLVFAQTLGRRHAFAEGPFDDL